MKTVLVTGADGFIGKNLVAQLRNEQIEVISYNKKNTINQLIEYVNHADFIFHLAGVNRPKDISEFEKGNVCFTEKLLNIMKENKRKIPILFSSSIQSEMDNPYGISKRKAEQEVFRYGNETGAEVFVYRLPNVFGKWCKPNYNSVVATWCYNIANNLPIHIDDPNKKLNLVYIDEVVEEFIQALNGNANKAENGFCSIKRVFQVSLKEIAEKLQSFRSSRKTLKMENLENDFDRYLYTTYLSYLSEDDFSYPLEMKHDNRGWLAEFIKSKCFGQIFISRTKPGITRGNHWHHTKVEKFLVIEGEAIIKFRKINSEEVIEYPVSGEQLKVVDIPPGYTHSITNVGNTDVITLFWANEIFNPEKHDTYYLEV